MRPLVLMRLRSLHPQDHEFSGRFLRRMPMLALARYMSTQYSAEDEQRPRSIERWLSAMEKVAEDEKRANDLVQAGAGRRLVDPVKQAEGSDVGKEGDGRGGST